MRMTWMAIFTATAATIALGCGRASAQESAPVTRTIDLGFVENGGQMAEAARFFHRSNGLTTFFTADGFVLQARPKLDISCPGEPIGVNLRLTFEGATGSGPLSGISPRKTSVNFFRGDDPSRWVTGLHCFDEVRYDDLYPGIDVRVHKTSGALEYDLLLDRGADPAQVSLRIEGADRIEVAQDGSLLLHTPLGMIRQGIPRTYAVSTDGQRRPVDCRYVRLSTDQFAFKVTGWNSDLERLVIDPTLAFTTFVGGSGSEALNCLVVSTDGKLYMAGQTLSTDFPVTSGAFDETFNGTGVGADDVFVVKMGDDGVSIEYATYIGGTDAETFIGEFACDISVDSLGQACVVGTTSATDFPVTAGAFQSTLQGSRDAFALRLSAGGDGLDFSTYLGGGGVENAASLAVDSNGRVLVTGDTSSGDFPITAQAFDTVLDGPGVFDGFVAALDSTGTTLDYGSYMGGTEDDLGLGIAVDPSDFVVVTGETDSNDFPVSSGAFSESSSGGQDIVALKVDTLAASPDFSTYLGGPGAEAGRCITTDTFGNIYIAGGVDSSIFPTTPTAFDKIFDGDSDAYATKINSTGTGIMWSTFLGGSGAGWLSEQANDISLQSDRQVVVTGRTNSGDFPTIGDDAIGTLSGNSDGFFTVIASNGASLEYSTLIGGSLDDSGRAVDVDGSDQAYIVGQSSSSDLSTTAGTVQPSFAGGFSDAFVAKYNVGCPGGFEAYGNGCPGTGGIVPAFIGLKCPEAGNTIALRLVNAFPNAPCVITIGVGQVPQFVNPSCLLENGPIFGVFPLVLGASGSFNIPVNIPPDATPGVLYLQVGIVDPGGAFNVALSNALCLGLGTPPVVN